MSVTFSESAVLVGFCSSLCGFTLEHGSRGFDARKVMAATHSALYLIGNAHQRM